VDTCASEFEAITPYFYSTYDAENESDASRRKKIIVINDLIPQVLDFYHV